MFRLPLERWFPLRQKYLEITVFLRGESADSGGLLLTALGLMRLEL